MYKVGIRKWENYYEVVQYRRQIRDRERKKDFGYLLIDLPSFFSSDKKILPRNS